MIPAFSARTVSPEAEEAIGRIMLDQARKEHSGKPTISVDDVVDLVLDGLTRKEIALRLHITVGELNDFMKRNRISSRDLLARRAS